MLTKQEALSKIDELKQYVDGLDKEFLVPKEIRITAGTRSFSMGLLFNDSKQELCWSYRDNVYGVSLSPLRTIKANLVPCRREDLKTGDLAFRNDYEDSDFKSIYQYCFIDKNKHWYIARKQIEKGSMSYRYWYKVVAC